MKVFNIKTNIDFDILDQNLSIYDKSDMIVLIKAGEPMHPILISERFEGVNIVLLDNAYVQAIGNVVVTALDKSKCIARENAQVHAFNNAEVELYGSSVGHIHNQAECWALKSSKVYAYDTATIHLYNDATFDLTNVGPAVTVFDKR